MFLCCCYRRFNQKFIEIKKINYDLRNIRMKRFYQCNEIHDNCHEILPMKKLASFAVTKKMGECRF